MIKVYGQFSFPNELRPKGYRGIIDANWNFPPQQDLGLLSVLVIAKLMDFYIETQRPTVREVQRQLDFINERIGHLVVEVTDKSGKVSRLQRS